MARILAFSSQVARGHVGLSAIVPALQRLGHDVIGLPTILLSNHPGHAHVAGERLDPNLLRRMLDALDDNGWIGGIDAILSGYLPSVEHVGLVAETVLRLRNGGREVPYVCDPVIGDDPKGLYVSTEIARAIGDTLLGLADLITPNRFELSWLARMPVTSSAEAAAALTRLQVKGLATSIPISSGNRGEAPSCLANVLIFGGLRLQTVVVRRQQVPHGTGDLMSSLFLGHWLATHDADLSLACATATIDALIAAGSDRDELELATPDPAFTQPQPWTTGRLDTL